MLCTCSYITIFQQGDDLRRWEGEEFWNIWLFKDCNSWAATVTIWSASLTLTCVRQCFCLSCFLPPWQHLILLPPIFFPPWQYLISWWQSHPKWPSCQILMSPSTSQLRSSTPPLAFSVLCKRFLETAFDKLSFQHESEIWKSRSALKTLQSSWHARDVRLRFLKVPG